MAKNDCAFAAEFAAIINFRLQSSEDKIYALTFYWFGSHFITTSMYSQFMLTIFRKIYRLLQPTYLATSSQRGLSLVSSLSLVNFCRKIQEFPFTLRKLFYRNCRRRRRHLVLNCAVVAGNRWNLCFTPRVCICVSVSPTHTCKSLHLHLRLCLHRTCDW